MGLGEEIAAALFAQTFGELRARTNSIGDVAGAFMSRSVCVDTEREIIAQVAAQVRPKLTTATLVLLDSSRVVAPLADRAGYDVAYLPSMDDAPAVCARLAEVIHG